MSIDYLFSSFLNLFYFLVVLGLAVTLHEWGHFIVAKWCGAKVTTFAIGMGQRLFSFTWGETEYAICLLPIGGYVNIVGMSPDDELTGAPWEFLQLPAWKRICIVAAGPIMNFVLAFFIYVFLFMTYGETYNATRTIGMVPTGSWGWEMGLREGDEIVSINNHEVKSWNDVQLYYSDFQDKKLNVTVKRDGQLITKTKDIPAFLLEEPEDSEQMEVPTDYKGIFVTGIVPNGVVEKAGLQPGSIVQSVDGKTFKTLGEWSDYLSTAFTKNDQGTYEPRTVELAYLDPEGNSKTLTITPEMMMPDADAIPYQPYTKIGLEYQGEISPKDFFIYAHSIAQLGIIPKLTPIIGGLQDGGPAQKAGIKSGDRIVEIDGKPMDNWVDIQTTVQDTITVDKDGNDIARPIEITWYTTENEMKSAMVTPYVAHSPLYTPKSLKTGKQYAIAQIGFDVKSDRRRMGIVGATVAGWERMVLLTDKMVDILYRLFTGGISYKVMGGPIAIFQMSAEHGRWGIEMLFGFIAMLSLNLGLLNLMPVPPLDGGHIVCYLFEFVSRRTPTLKQMENFGKVGFAIIVPLMLFMIFNDLNRVNFFGWISDLIGKVF